MNPTLTVPVLAQLIAQSTLAATMQSPTAADGMDTRMEKLAAALLPRLSHYAVTENSAPSPAAAAPGDAPVALPRNRPMPLDAVRMIHARLTLLGRMERTAAQEHEDDFLPGFAIRCWQEVLCWALGCGSDLDKGFRLNMARASKALRESGVHPSASGPLTADGAAALRSAGERYIRIAPPPSPPVAIQCLTCLQVSHSPDDLANLFCGHCKVFHDELLDADRAALESWAAARSAEAEDHG